MTTPALDHITFTVTDIDRAKAFYAAALAPLGFSLMMEFPRPGGSVAGFGTDKPYLWIGTGDQTSRVHIAFGAPSRAAVDAFYAAAMAAGGRDNGAPGLRPHYHENYYGAFVIDPEGHNIEAVCHQP